MVCEGKFYLLFQLLGGLCGGKASSVKVRVLCQGGG